MCWDTWCIAGGKLVSTSKKTSNNSNNGEEISTGQIDRKRHITSSPSNCHPLLLPPFLLLSSSPCNLCMNGYYYNLLSSQWGGSFTCSRKTASELWGLWFIVWLYWRIVLIGNIITECIGIQAIMQEFVKILKAIWRRWEGYVCVVLL